MTTAQKFRGRRTASVAAFALLAAGLSGCGAVNQQATTIDYAASDGIVFDLGDVHLSNLLLVTTSKDAKARLIGSLINDSGEDVSVDVTVNGNSATIDVPRNASVELEDDVNKVVLPSAGDAPGSLTETTVKIGSSSTQEKVPVVDGTLKYYRPFVPGGFNEETIQHLKPTQPILEGHE